MGSCLIEVHDISIQHSLELLLVEDQQMIEAFLSDAPEEAFADSIGACGLNWPCEDLDHARFRHPSKARPELAIVITNQTLGYLPIRGRFPELLCHPGIRRGSCHAHVDHFPRLQFDDEERNLALRILLHSPKDTVAGAMAAAIVIAIIANALFLQAGRHPAPMFGAFVAIPASHTEQLQPALQPA